MHIQLVCTITIIKMCLNVLSPNSPKSALALCGLLLPFYRRHSPKASHTPYYKHFIYFSLFYMSAQKYTHTKLRITKLCDSAFHLYIVSGSVIGLFKRTPSGDCWNGRHRVNRFASMSGWKI